MLLALSLHLFLASGVSAPAVQVPIEPPAPRIQQTIRTDASGNAQIESHAVEAGATTHRSIQADGRVVEQSSGPAARVLIELDARPVLDRMHPGSLAAVAGQREQLA